LIDGSVVRRAADLLPRMLADAWVANDSAKWPSGARMIAQGPAPEVLGPRLVGARSRSLTPSSWARTSWSDPWRPCWMPMRVNSGSLGPCWPTWPWEPHRGPWEAPMGPLPTPAQGVRMVGAVQEPGHTRRLLPPIEPYPHLETGVAPVARPGCRLGGFAPGWPTALGRRVGGCGRSAV